LPLLENKKPLFFHCSFSNMWVTFSCGKSPLKFELVPHHTRLESGTSELAFASSSPLTTKHCERCMLTVPPIIDLFICLEDCCHVTSKNPNCNCHSSTVVTSTLTIYRDRIQVHFLVPAVCKVHSSNNSCYSLWNCCRGKTNDLNFRESNA
jgi:hypothetical protein